ncbi:RNA polymerase sigma factor SigI [Bacillus sp. DNRA2]|uniref:RNA polymerase sigma factor SigI n=1 Tax=Bacillus sp. DNRA2 TaxID=2723053 RepID=UPI00145EA812|nr:RNA polymerase sigma factor SigI [Bacillus sp. DNRA2]NMD71429.1 RNA polymerase sigma factor SigI [Bacillus sp. DNRA2]
MFGLIFFKKKKPLNLEESIALIQQGDRTLQNELIENYKPFIAKTVSAVCKRYIYETDDEYSIGLIAFNEAIEKFSTEKGKSLLSFAEVIIKRRVIDYIRKNTKENNLRFDTSFDVQGDETQSGLAIENELSIEHHLQKQEAEKRREEILLFHQKLQGFGLSLQEIIDQAPKHADARINAISIAKLICENEELLGYLLDKKRLPIKELEKYAQTSRKTIERNRKYIIAMSIILSEEFYYLQDYLKGVIKE